MDISGFSNAIKAAGLEPPPDILPGKVHRFPGYEKHKGNTAGWCRLFEDGQGGVYGDWSTGLSEHWQAKREEPWTPAEREAFRKRVAEEKTQAEAERKAVQNRAATEAQEQWDRATPETGEHRYLRDKSIQPHGARSNGHQLLIPMRHNGKLYSLQRISPDGSKKFLQDGRVSGCYFSIGKPAGTLCIAEGFATGASIHEATEFAVAVTFTSGNLLAVAKALRAKFPEIRLIICADDDHKTSGNPGVTKATEAAKAVNGLVAIPDFGDDRPEGASDFNDLTRHRGPDAVKKAIESAIHPEVTGGNVDMPTNARMPASPDGESGQSINIVNDEGKPRAQAAILTDIGRTHQLFHDDGDAYAKVGGRVYSVTGADYRDILGREFYLLTGKGANRNALSDAVSTLSAIAKFDGGNERVYLRVGEQGNSIIIDAGTRDCKTYKITPDGWEAVNQSPINFRRSGRPMPLPVPTEPDFSRIWKYVNVATEHRVLVAGWLLSALRPRGPYPALALVDEQGSGKSFSTRILKRLSDPSASLLRSPPRDERDLQVAAVSSWVLALDNMSGIDHQLSDALCRLSTGGALSGRKLYTDSDETLIEVQRPAILNGIDDLASRPDLAERCLHVHLPTIQTRRTEEELNRAFDEDGGHIFAALLDGLSMALATSPHVALARTPRMADFAKWAAAGIPALGFEQDEFLAAYLKNQAEAIETGLDSSPIGQAIREFMADRDTWTGTAQELLRLLNYGAGDRIKTRAWPQSPKGIVNALRRLAPSLRHTGITWTTTREGNSRVHTLFRVPCKVAKQVAQAAQVAKSGGESATLPLAPLNPAPCTTASPDAEYL